MSDTVSAETTAPASRRRGVMGRFLRHRSAVLGAVILLLLALSAIFAPVLMPYDPMEISAAIRHQGPSAQHWLGTDFFGRDVLSRLLIGSRISLGLGIVVVVLRVVIGVPLGLVAGYFGGRIDRLLMRLTDVFLAIPEVLFALAIMAIRGPGFWNLVLALTIKGWTGFARLARGQAIALRDREYIQASRAIGLPSWRIMLQHVLPNSLSVLVVYATMNVAYPILTESTLSFLGLGMPPTVPTWGSMLNTDRAHITTAWWATTFPGLAIVITVLAFNLLGDGLRDALDPKQTATRGTTSTE